MAPSPPSPQPKLDEASLASLFSCLRDHAEAVDKLQEVLKRDQLDVQIMAAQRS